MFQTKATLLKIPPFLPTNLLGITEMDAKNPRYERGHTVLHRKYSGDVVMVTFIQAQDYFAKKPAGL